MSDEAAVKSDYQLPPMKETRSFLMAAGTWMEDAVDFARAVMQRWKRADGNKFDPLDEEDVSVPQI